MQKYFQFIFKLVPITSVALSSLFTFNNSALAQVGISPMVIESQASQGQSEAVVNVFNPTLNPIRVRIFSEPFTYSRDGQFQTLSSSKQDLSSYLQFSPRELTLEPGESRKARIS